MSKGSQDAFPLLAYVDGLMEDLRRNVPQALKKWDADAIHDARVATRRLKAAVDLMEFVLSRKQRQPFARILKKLRRRLGPLRDLDVMIEHLEKLAPGEAHRPAAEWLAQCLRGRRDKEREKALEAGGPAAVLSKLGSWWGLREEVLEAEEAMDSLLAESLHLQLDAFVERSERLIAQSGGAPPDANGADPSARQDPHQLRIAGKILRYTLEMAAQQGHKLPASVMRDFKKMQEALGLWHDYVVLTEQAMTVSLDALLPHHDAAMQARVLELARLFLRRATRQLEQFSGQWKRRGDSLARTIREKFPLTRPSPPAAGLSEPGTDRDRPSLSDKPVPVGLPPDVASTA